MTEWKQESINIGIGYLLSWVYVLLVLSFFQRMFGKTKGILVAYGSSFLVWYAVLYILNQREII
jgi:hypothetical protein